MEDLNRTTPKGYALIPFLVFVITYLATGIILNQLGYELAFYQVPAPIFIFVGIIFAFILFKGTTEEKMNTFIQGCGDENIIIMCIIFLLAGAFSTLANESGAVESVVNLFLTFIPVKFVTAGIFLIAAFLGTATGTSVGTVVALGSISVGIADKGNLPVAMVLGALVGGAMLGDNLSIISDTTIAATRTQGVSMKDKFRMNFKIVLPAAILAMVLYFIFGIPEGALDYGNLDYNLLKVVPYLFVLITAIAGLNVFVVLTSGIVLSIIVGIVTNAFLIEEGSNLGLTIANHVYAGFTSVTEIFLLSLLTGGLAFMVRKEGGIDWLIQKMRGFIRGKKSAELSVAGLVSLTDVALANNTVSIVVTGPVAKELAVDYDVDPRRMASILDIFACIFQGLIPYGAQLLIAAGMTDGAVSPVEIIPMNWYAFLVGASAIISMYVRFSDHKEKTVTK